MDISDKNIYEYLTNFVDDHTILQMISVNKKFNDPIFFERILDRKYPYLKELKNKDESWRRFFVRMTYYIAKLDEEYGIPYIPTEGYNPEDFYNIWNKREDIYNNAMRNAALGGHLKIVKYLIDQKGADDFNEAMAWAAAGGHLEIVKYLIKKGEEIGQELSFNYAMFLAAKEGQMMILKYLIDQKGADKFNTAMIYAAEKGHLEIVKYLIDQKGADAFNRAMEYAARGGHLEIVKYLIEEKGADVFIQAMVWAARGEHSEIVEYLKQFI